MNHRKQSTPGELKAVEVFGRQVLAVQSLAVLAIFSSSMTLSRTERMLRAAE